MESGLPQCGPVPAWIGEFRLVPDDFENRVVYGPIVHKTLPTSGRKVAELKSFWSQGARREAKPGARSDTRTRMTRQSQ